MKTSQTHAHAHARLQDILEDILHIQSVSGNCYAMHNAVTQKLRALDIPYHVDTAGNIIATKGTPPDAGYYPGICAHLDTVHDIVPEDEYEVRNYTDDFGNILYTNDTGIGGDDKCGIALVLSALEHLDMPMKAFFFVDEETGCVGSSELSPTETLDVGYLIQPDRKGSSDIIAAYCGADSVSKRFRKIMRPIARTYKYSETSGLFTDVFTVQDSAKVSAINFSCGYYDAHTDAEFIDFTDLCHAQAFMFDLLEALGTRRFQCFRKQRSWSKSKYPYEHAGVYSGTSDDYDDYDAPHRFTSAHGWNSAANGSSYRAPSKAQTCLPSPAKPTKQEMIDEYKELFGTEPQLTDRDIENLR